MSMSNRDPAKVYRKLGVTPIIHAAGTVTRFGGTRTRPEILDLMAGAAGVLVEMNELNARAGQVIAELTGADAGLVCSGAAGGLVLQAAACIAGQDPAKMHQLPDSEGMRNEIIIQNMHRFPYDQAYRSAGGKLVGIGDGKRCHPWQLEAAINERTAAVAYVCSPFNSRRALPLDEVCQIAHQHGVPVIVDAASMLPPRANLRHYLAQGVGHGGIQRRQGSARSPRNRHIVRPQGPDGCGGGQRQPVPGAPDESGQRGDRRTGDSFAALR